MTRRCFQFLYLHCTCFGILERSPDQKRLWRRSASAGSLLKVPSHHYRSSQHRSAQSDLYCSEGVFLQQQSKSSGFCKKIPIKTMARSRRNRGSRSSQRPQEENKPLAKAVYIYPGLLRLAKQKAINLDSQCPAAIFKCKKCADGNESNRSAPPEACQHSNGCSVCLEDFHQRDLVRKLPCSAQHMVGTLQIALCFSIALTNCRVAG